MADLNRTVGIVFTAEDRGSQAADAIARKLAGTGDAAGDAAGKTAQLDRELDKLGGNAPKLSAVTAGLQALAASLVVKAFIDANVEAEKFTRTMTLLKGSSTAAAEEFDYVKRVSNDLGLELGVTANAYASLTAATNGTNLQGEGTRVIFEAVSRAMAALGRSSEETSGAFLAITQIVSKGRVSLEELNGQLGERLPGALQIAARGLGLTTGELTKLVEKGDLTAEQFLPAFARELDKTFAGATFDGYTGSLARLRNSIDEAFVTIGNTGAFDALIKGLQVGTVAVAATISNFVLLGEVVGAVLAKLSLGTSFDLGAALSESFAKAAKSTEGARNALFGAEKAATGLGTAGIETGNKLAEGLGKGALSADALKKAAADIEKSLKALGIDPKTFSDPVKELGQAFKDLSANAAASGEQIVTGLIGALQRLPNNSSLQEFRVQVGLAYRDGRLNAEEYAQAVALIETKQKNLSPSFGPVSEAARKQAEELRKSGEAAKKTAEELDKYKLELEKLASNERIKNIEARVTLKVAELENQTKRVVSAFDSINNTVNSTEKSLGDLFGLFKDPNLSFSQISLIRDQIEKENKRRDDALRLQGDLTRAQIDKMKAETDSISRGDALIKIDGAGLQPHLEAFMWEILRTIQTRVNQDGLKLLLGA